MRPPATPTAETGQATALLRGQANFSDETPAGLVGNGRSCATCHMPDAGFQLSPTDVERRYAALLAARRVDEDADDPLFRAVDANDFRIHGEAANDFTNLRHGLIRIAIPLPANMRLIDPQTGAPSNERMADVWRAVPTIFNVAVTGPDEAGPVWRIGPNPRGGYQLDARIDSLRNQALAALRDHAQISRFPGDDWLRDIETFETAQFSSQGVRRTASAILAGRTSFPAPDPRLNALERRGKKVFERSCSSCHGSGAHPSTSTVTSPPLTQRYHPIESACPRPTGKWCGSTGCFTFPQCDEVLQRTVRTYELTSADGSKERITTSDPGRLLLSGDLTDVDSFDHSQGVFDIPQLYGIARTAPYFHNNSAATLEDVLSFYQAFFARREVLAPTSAFVVTPFGPFTEGEKPALLAYLRRL